MHHVAVGQDQSIRSEYESRSSSVPLPWFSRACPSGILVHFNIHHRRTHALNRASHRTGVSVQKGIVADALRRRGRFLRAVPSNNICTEMRQTSQDGGSWQYIYIFLIHAE
jgi:hypothetical protein